MAGPLNNNQYRVIITGTCAPAVTSDVATLTVNNNPIVTGPVNTSVCAGSNGTFSVTASGTGLTYQWQQKIGAGAFTNLVDGGVYSGSLTSALTLTGVPVGMNGYFFRCIVSSTCGGNTTSAQATLTVVAAIVNTISCRSDDMHRFQCCQSHRECCWRLYLLMADQHRICQLPDL